MILTTINSTHKINTRKVCVFFKLNIILIFEYNMTNNKCKSYSIKYFYGLKIAISFLSNRILNDIEITRHLHINIRIRFKIKGIQFQVLCLYFIAILYQDVT